VRTGRHRRAHKGLWGLAKRAHKRVSDFNPRALAKGIRVEMEHTEQRSIARRIAMDHLTEDPRYYDKLARMEHGGYGRDPLTRKERRLLRERHRIIDPSVHPRYPNVPDRGANPRASHYLTTDSAIEAFSREGNTEAYARGRGWGDSPTLGRVYLERHRSDNMWLVRKRVSRQALHVKVRNPSQKRRLAAKVRSRDPSQKPARKTPRYASGKKKFSQTTVYRPHHSFRETYQGEEPEIGQYEKVDERLDERNNLDKALWSEERFYGSRDPSRKRKRGPVKRTTRKSKPKSRAKSKTATPRKRGRTPKSEGAHCSGAPILARKARKVEPPHTCPSATKVQSLVFERWCWTLARAKSWAKRHGYKDEAEVTERYYRFRQLPTKTYKPVGTVPFMKGLNAIMGCTRIAKSAKKRKKS